MKDKPTSSSFSTTDYVRPNQDWVCGHLCKGEACRIGPSPGGKCRVTFECVPLLDKNEGYEKGRYKCSRPASAGGTCKRGPLPDGTCCNAIPKCQPRRTLRNIRKRVVVFTIIASFIVLFIGLDRTNRDEFVNPAPISSPHASKHFSNLTKKITGDDSNCAACHESARKNASTWPAKIGESLTGALAPRELIKKGLAEPSGMDQNCIQCHEDQGNVEKTKAFHVAHMPQDIACHECHKEHAGSGFIEPVSNDYCVSCHGSSELMTKASSLAGQTVKPILDFDKGHPDFSYPKDTNTLKFNHKLHFGTKSDGTPIKVEKIDGTSLSCSDCHQSDSEGEYQIPINYENHCKSCHELQFDPDSRVFDERLRTFSKPSDGESADPNPLLPHGDASEVRSFLRSLNLQFEEHGRNTLGITDRAALKAYVDGKRKYLEEEVYRSGSAFEEFVFFAEKKRGRNPTLPNGKPAKFEGCAKCHEVEKPLSSNGTLILNATPVVTKPVILERWMKKSSFSHALHQTEVTEDEMKSYVERKKNPYSANKAMTKAEDLNPYDQQCVACHEVLDSSDTSNVNHPSIASCTDCHSEKGGIDHRCITCHSFHNGVANPHKVSGSLFGDLSEPVSKDESAEE